MLSKDVIHVSCVLEAAYGVLNVPRHVAANVETSWCILYGGKFLSPEDSVSSQNVLCVWTGVLRRDEGGSVAMLRVMLKWPSVASENEFNCNPSSLSSNGPGQSTLDKISFAGAVTTWESDNAVKFQSRRRFELVTGCASAVRPLLLERLDLWVSGPVQAVFAAFQLLMAHFQGPESERRMTGTFEFPNGHRHHVSLRVTLHDNMSPLVAPLMPHWLWAKRPRPTRSLAPT